MKRNKVYERQEGEAYPYSEKQFRQGRDLQGNILTKNTVEMKRNVSTFDTNFGARFLHALNEYQTISNEESPPFIKNKALALAEKKLNEQRGDVQIGIDLAFFSTQDTHESRTPRGIATLDALRNTLTEVLISKPDPQKFIEEKFCTDDTANVSFSSFRHTLGREKFWENFQISELAAPEVISHAVDSILKHWYQPETPLYFSDDILKEFCLARIELFKREKAEFVETTFEMIKQMALANIYTLARKCNIPLTHAEIDKILEHVHIEFVDPLAGGVESNAGAYIPSSDTIHISIGGNRSTEDYTKTLMHEYLHALSGKTFFITEHTSIDADPTDETNGDAPDTLHENISSTRIHIDPKKVGISLKERFQWLEEAITEDLCHDSIEDGVYQTERMVLQHLSSLGLDRKQLLSSHFEDYSYHERIAGTPTQNTHALPNTKKLFKQTDKALWKGALIHIDTLLRSNKRNGQLLNNKIAKDIIKCTTVEELKTFVIEGLDGSEGDI